MRPFNRFSNEPPPSKHDDHRINGAIRVDKIRLIDENGNPMGIVSTYEGIKAAERAGLDLVEVASGASPPVCKILNYSKFKYEEQKKKAEARKNQKTIVIKEIKMRPGIDDNDYNVKMRSIKRFIEEGDKVKVVLRFRGREMAHREIGMKVLDRVREEIADFCKIEQLPKAEGMQVIMMLAPKV